MTISTIYLESDTDGEPGLLVSLEHREVDTEAIPQILQNVHADLLPQLKQDYAKELAHYQNLAQTYPKRLRDWQASHDIVSKYEEALRAYNEQRHAADAEKLHTGKAPECSVVPDVPSYEHYPLPPKPDEPVAPPTPPGLDGTPLTRQELIVWFPWDILAARIGSCEIVSVQKCDALHVVSVE